MVLTGRNCPIFSKYFEIRIFIAIFGFSMTNSLLTRRTKEPSDHKEVPPVCNAYEEGSSVASPICQDRQSERTFPIFSFSSQFFPLFFLIFSLIFPILAIFCAVKGGILPPPWPPGGYGTGRLFFQNSLSFGKPLWIDYLNVLSYNGLSYFS